MRISERKYLRAKAIVEEYEKQQDNCFIDKYFNDYSTLEEATHIMNNICNKYNKYVFCYQKSNGKFVISLNKIIGADPIAVVSYGALTNKI